MVRFFGVCVGLMGISCRLRLVMDSFVFVLIYLFVGMSCVLGLIRFWLMLVLRCCVVVLLFRYLCLFCCVMILVFVVFSICRL